MRLRDRCSALAVPVYAAVAVNRIRATPVAPAAAAKPQAEMLRAAALRTLSRAATAAREDEAAAAQDGGGIAVRPRRGRVVFFFSRLNDGSVDPMSWHGGADCLSGDGKWTLQLFKELPEGCAEDYVRQRRAALVQAFA